MTDKQIIIDGVDVSGCEYCLKMTKYRCTIQRDVYKCLCEENPNCHYKQLKRKEQEVEELKEQLSIDNKDEKSGHLDDKNRLTVPISLGTEENWVSFKYLLDSPVKID